MKRRGFLASLLGLAAAPIAGLLPAMEPTYCAILHPDGRGFVHWKTSYSSAILNDRWLGKVENFRVFDPGTST